MERKIFLFSLILFTLLLLRLFVFYSMKTGLKDGDYIKISTRLLSEPKEYGVYQGFTIQTQKGDRIFVKTDSYPMYSYGDNLAISGTLNLQLLNGNQFLFMKNPKISLVKNNGPDFLAVFIVIRQKFITLFNSVLPSDPSALLLGIVFGIKGDLTKNFADNIKTTGVMHVIAASGMNVTMVAGFIFYLFSLVLKRQIAIFASVIGILFYSILSGFEPSIIRASIMAIMAFSAQGLGRQSYSYYSLFLTAFLMLFIWPQFLFDVGFQLSFASTMGILVIPEVLKLKFPLSGDFMTTVSAQIASLPILLVNFGTYSIWSVVVNTLVLWTVPILMIFGELAAVFSFFEPLAKVFLYLSLPLLVYFEDIVNYFAGLKGTIMISEIPWQFVLSYYFFLLFLLTFFLKKRPKNAKNMH